MKKGILIFVLFVLSSGACKKSSTSGAISTQPVKTYSVTYKFISNSNQANFDITYSDVSGQQHTLTSQSSGWQLTFTANAGTYCALSATSHVSGASAHVEIDYNNIVLTFNDYTGSGLFAYASCSATLPD